MDRTSRHKSALDYLYPALEPWHRQMLDVGDGHSVYVEQCGRPDGVPVVVLHGGPGGGCSPAMRRYFDPAVFRVILFDQRGCGKSRPHASVDHNTTWDLVGDIERIREKLGIEKWIVFGGSWGATLALIYAQSHPQAVIHLVLRSVFLMTRAELDWFYQGGAGRFWPESWARFVEPIPAGERDDLIAAYARRLFCGDRGTETRYARSWAAWENGLASINSSGVAGESPAEYARAFARLENHYFTHGGFLREDGQVLTDLPNIADIGGTIIHGRYDMICPPSSAVRLKAGWAKADLRIVPHAGHALSEPGITAELVQAMDRLGHKLG